MPRCSAQSSTGAVLQYTRNDSKYMLGVPYRLPYTINRYQVCFKYMGLAIARTLQCTQPSLHVQGGVGTTELSPAITTLYTLPTPTFEVISAAVLAVHERSDLRSPTSCQNMDQKKRWHSHAGAWVRLHSQHISFSRGSCSQPVTLVGYSGHRPCSSLRDQIVLAD